MTINPLKKRSTANVNSLEDRFSRYVAGGLSETANGFIEWWERFNFARDATDIVYVIENIYEGRADLIAAAFYNDPRLGWFICQFNNIIDPTTEITPGRILLIPTKDRMTLMLSSKTGGFPSTRQPIATISNIIS